VTDTYEATPHSNGYYHVAATYWPDGLLNMLSWNLLGFPSWTYTPDGEGRAYSVSASSGQNPLTSTAYNGFGEPTSVNFGSLDSDNFTYDPNTGRMTQYEYNVNGSVLIGNLAWNANGTFEQLAITDPFTVARQYFKTEGR
jgi:RHS repeat-associated protein